MTLPACSRAGTQVNTLHSSRTWWSKATGAIVLALLAMPVWGQMGPALPQGNASISYSRPVPAMPPAMSPDFQAKNLPRIPGEFLNEMVLPPMPGVVGTIAHVPLKYDVTKIGNRGIGSGINFYSLQREQAMGKELATEVESSVKLITDPVVTEYVNRLGQTLVRNSDAQVPFTIKVIDSDEINAFALPGGYFYVNSGLILAADNEAELAGVMSHEIAHVAARHATKNATRGDILNLASIPLIFIGGPIGYAVREVASLAVPMTFLKFSRDMEREADLLGMEYEYAAGYDPSALVDFFERLEMKKKQKHSALAKAFATHPMTEDRIKRAEQEISTMLPPKQEYLVTTSEFDEVKARLMSDTNRLRLKKQQTGDRPTLRRRTDNGGTTTTTSEDDQRPTLHRKDPN